MKYLKLLRVKQYVKNILIFFPVLFAKEFFSVSTINVIEGFIAFCFLSSVVYIINDIKDAPMDKLHPDKKDRPLASGKIKLSSAVIMLIVCFLFSVIFNYLSTGFSLYSWLLLLIYFVLNIFYSFIAKNIIILDILLLVSFYIIRLYYGAAIVDVEVSNWLYLTIMSVSFFFAFSKRRNELIKYKSKSRKVLENYNKSFLDKFMYVSFTLSIVFYSLWVLDQNIKYLFFTIPFIFVILMKYSLIVEMDPTSDPTETMLKDKVIIALIFILGLFFLYIMR